MGHVTWMVDSGGHVTTIDWRTADAGTRVKLGEEGTRDVRSAVSVEGDQVRVVTNTDVWDLRDTKTATCQVTWWPYLAWHGTVPWHWAMTSWSSLSYLGSKFEHRGHRSDVTGMTRLGNCYQLWRPTRAARVETSPLKISTCYIFRMLKIFQRGLSIQPQKLLFQQNASPISNRVIDSKMHHRPRRDGHTS